ncbi:hypothetical protein HYW46_06990 [Candidatus Daviesbacteria bacterium]|nr:hypothetical protein [Candidatus Daviesbacteria bacterium]
MKKEGGYIGMIMVFLFFLVMLIVWPLDLLPPPSQVAPPGGCQSSPGNQTIILSNGTFRAVLSNLYINIAELDTRGGEFYDKLDGAKIFKVFENIQIDGKNYIVYQSDHTKINQTSYKTRDFGLAFAVPLDANGKPIIVEVADRKQGGVEGVKKGTYLLSTVFQNVNNSTPLPKELLDSCGDPSNAKLDFPSQSPSADQKQLQLQYFLFQGGGAGFWSLHCKPAIYLYPPVKTLVNVRVKTKGELIYTDPKYPEGGWNVIAFPDGTIHNLPTSNNQSLTSNLQLTYPYLYYESRVPDKLINIPNDGYIVTFDKLSFLYDLLLPKLGLDTKQASDFKEYWSKALPYSPYYFVGIMSQEDINSIEPLEITPKPDSINRVRLYFKSLDKKPTDSISNFQFQISNFKSSNYQPLTPNLQAPSSNFHVTEWGGMVKNNPLEPFTCSQ